MNSNNVSTPKQIGKIGLLILLIVVSSILVHVAVMIVDYYMIKKPLMLNLQKDFIGTAFSFPMVPMILAYGVFNDFEKFTIIF